MQSDRRFAYVSMTALVAFALLVACAQTTPSEPEVIRETVVVPQTVEHVVTPTPVPPPVKQEGPVFIGTGGMTGKHYNPIWMTSNPQMLTFPLILPALTWFDDQVQPVPDLATDIEVNEDATEYIFHLPEEATWSDGEPLTAQDVLFTYELAVHPDIGQSVWVNAFAAVEGVAAYREREAEGISGIEALDDHTVRFHLSEPNASFLYNTYLGILPEHVLGDVDPAAIEQHPYVDAPTVTSGPYEFVTYEPEQYIQLKRREDYWGEEQVAIDEIYVKLFESTATLLAQLEAGEIDLAEIPADELERFRSMPHIEVLSVRGIGYHVTHIDFRDEDQIRKLNLPTDQGGKGYNIPVQTKPYLQDVRFRQALAYAVDANAVIQVVAGGEATPIYSPIFGPDWAVNPNLNTYDRDVERARALLEEAGVTFNDKGAALWEGEPITLVYLATTGEAARQFGEVLQQQFGDVGIRLDIKLVTSAAFLSAAIDGEGDLILNAGGRFGADPSVSSLYYTCSAGWAELVIGYCNPEFDRLMQQGVAVSDPDQRQEIYWQASAILNEELPSLFFFTANRFFGVNKGVGGVKPSADPGYLTWNIEDWVLQ